MKVYTEMALLVVLTTAGMYGMFRLPSTTGWFLVVGTLVGCVIFVTRSRAIYDISDGGHLG